MAAQTSQGGRETLSRQRVLAGVVTLGVVAVVLGSVVVLSGAPATPAQAQSSGPTEISSWTELDAVREDLDGDYVLVNDLNQSTAGYEDVAGPTANNSNGFDPIGEFGSLFSGTFDGNGHMISDLVIDRFGESDIGLFGASSGEISDITLANAVVAGSINVGGLVGDNVGTVSDSSASGAVDGSDNVGGLVGFNGGTVSNASASGAVNGNANVGGLVGNNNDDGTVSESSASGTVTGDLRVGGLVGASFNSGTVSESSASGDVNGSRLVGGLVGDNNAGTVENVEASATVTGDLRVGGLAGASFIGGTVSGSSASGAVTGSSVFVGGLVGENNGGTVSNASASGAVTGFGAVGGLVGDVVEGSVTESFAVGSVTGDVNVGGLAGRLGNRGNSPGEEAILRNSYFDTQTTGQSAAVGVIEQGDGTAETRGEVTGLPTSRMQGSSAEIYMSTLDFANTWMTVTDPDDYPVLQAGQSGAQEGPILADYANDQDVVVVDGLLDALDDWRGGEIGVDLLLDVLDAWRSGDPVT